MATANGWEERPSLTSRWSCPWRRSHTLAPCCTKYGRASGSGKWLTAVRRWFLAASRTSERTSEM